MKEPARKSILLVEDEENLHDALRLNLELGKLPGYFSL